MTIHKIAGEFGRLKIFLTTGRYPLPRPLEALVPELVEGLRNGTIGLGKIEALDNPKPL